jgi:DNA-binding beta-propeller fold protein YncE
MMKSFVRRAAGLGSFWLIWSALVGNTGLCATAARAQDFDVNIIATGLNQPVGLAASALGDSDTLYFTETPQAAMGVGTNGSNTISKLTLSTGQVSVLNRGDPQPTSVVQDAQGNLYWTSRAPGVIMMQAPSGDCAILAWGLQQPIGIALDAAGENLYFTEDPTYGVPGVNGGENRVSQLNLVSGARTVLNALDPAPWNIAIAKNGDAYFTCRSAGIIIHQDGTTQKQSPMLTGLQQPTGIALDPAGENLYYTEVPTPGVSGANGGTNAITKYNLASGTGTLVHSGDPYPNSLAVAPNGNVYWTCTSAGVIIEAKPKAGN